MMTLRNRNASGDLNASVNFLVQSDGKPRVEIPEEGQGLAERSGIFEDRLLQLIDGRSKAEHFTLDQHGFSFHYHKTNISNFLDKHQVLTLYFDEVEELLKLVTGAKKIHIFDHTIRIEDEVKRNQVAVRAPVEVAHNDYTEKSGPQRVRDIFEEKEAEDWLQNRYAIINVWRPIGRPVVTKPLALSDASTMRPEDFIATDLVYKDRVGEISQIKYNERQCWYYFSEMVRDEALLIKCFDSIDDGRARYTAHAAFSNPNAPINAPPRESIEVRTLVSF